MTGYTVQEVLRFVQNATSPAAMSKQDALDFLEQIKDNIDASIDALRDEIAAERE